MRGVVGDVQYVIEGVGEHTIVAAEIRVTFILADLNNRNVAVDVTRPLDFVGLYIAPTQRVVDGVVTTIAVSDGLRR